MALDAVGLISPLMARLPGSLTAQLAGPLNKANDLQASNIPGIRREAYLAGALIERMYLFGPLPGCAAMITLLSHGQTACVAANLDTASFPNNSCSNAASSMASPKCWHCGPARTTRSTCANALSTQPWPVSSPDQALFTVRGNC